MDRGTISASSLTLSYPSLAWGALFAILILYLFLKDLRPTVITLVSYPHQRYFRGGAYVFLRRDH